MKFIFVTICALLVACSAAPTEEFLEQCDLCNKIFTLRQTSNIPSEIQLPEEIGYFEKNCAACEFVEETDDLSNEMQNEWQEEGLVEDQQDGEMQDESEEADLTDDTYAMNLISITNCRTCKAIIDFTAKHSHDFSYFSIKTALSHACSSHAIKWLDTARCHLFIKARRERIIQSIVKYHMDSTGTCLSLGQC